MSVMPRHRTLQCLLALVMNLNPCLLGTCALVAHVPLRCRIQRARSTDPSLLVQHPRYSPNKSKTHRDFACDADVCTSHKCDRLQRCSYSRKYAEHSSSSGYLTLDSLSFTPAPQGYFTNRYTLSSADVVFGCTLAETGAIARQAADGMLGLGRGLYSVVQQLVKDSTVGLEEFSLCYGGSVRGDDSRGSGLLVLGSMGALPAAIDMQYTNFDRMRM